MVQPLVGVAALLPPIWQADGQRWTHPQSTSAITHNSASGLVLAPHPGVFRSLLLTHSNNLWLLNRNLQRQLLLGCRQRGQHLALASHGSKLQAVMVLQQHVIQDAPGRL